MRNTRLHYSGELAVGRRIELDEAASIHVRRVLRLKDGTPVVVFNGQGGEFEGVIVGDGERRRVHVQINARRDPATESRLRITLVQGISRGERMDYTLQKSVELGVHRIIALDTEYSQVRLDGARLERRIDHWRGIIRGACEQSGRTRVPDLHAGMSLTQWLAGASIGTESSVLRLVLDPRAERGLTAVGPNPVEVVLLAGPEGGLSDAEVALARNAGFTGCRLGPRILRTETAGIAALAALQVLWGDLG